MKISRLSAVLLATALMFSLHACGVPDISDRDVHPVGTDQVDPGRFNEGRYHFPDSTWILYERPSDLGWNEERLQKIGQMADSLESAALMVVHKGVLIYDWGATDEKYLTQSMRKGLLSSLIGVAWDRGILRLDATLNELGIDDEPPLSETEKSATVEELLQSTSGIYHSAIYELGEWKREKPARGIHRPGETWYYNNWGFNALGTLYERITQKSIGEAFYEEIAVPLRMQDFEPGDVEYLTQDHRSEKWMGNRSRIPAYIFSTSARDMARFGLLYLNRGNWDGEQILSDEWISKSWSPVDIEMYYTLKFGYMWWMFEEGTIYINRDMGFEDTIYFTSGDGGHAIFVIPYLDLVVVHRVHERGIDFRSQMKRGFLGMDAEVEDDDLYNLLREVRLAHPYDSGQL